MNKLCELSKQVCNMTDEEKQKLVDACGSIILWTEEARSIGYMCDNLNLLPWQIEANINEMLYVLRKRIGIRRYLKILFMK